VKSKLNNLLRELSDDDDNDGADTAHPSVLEDPKRPWLKDFQAYLDTTEYVPDGWTTTVWWGVSDSERDISAIRLTSLQSSMLIAIQSGLPWHWTTY
jgi:hypothetical protein